MPEVTMPARFAAFIKLDAFRMAEVLKSEKFGPRFPDVELLRHPTAHCHCFSPAVS